MTASTATAKTITPTKQNNKSTPKERKYSLLVKLSVVFVLIAISVLSPGGWALAYKGRIYPNVKIANVSVGGKTIEQAKQALEPKINELKNSGPTLIYSQEEMKPSLEELGVTFNADTAVSAAFNYGRKESLKGKFAAYFNIVRNGAEMDLPLSVDETKLHEYVAGLSSKIAKEPTNATVSVANGQIVVTPAKEGIGFDEQKILSDLGDYINNSSTAQPKIVLEFTKIQAKVQAENTNQAVEATARYLAIAPINVIYADRQWTADRSEIGRWMRYSVANTTITTSADPTSFIKKISKEVAIPARDRQIEDGTGRILDEGQDGLGIDEKVLSAQIKNTLNAGGNKTIDLPVYDIARSEKTVFPHAMPGRYAGRYIDINLSEQTLYAFDGQNQITSFLVSTGKSGYATPTGEFHVYSKSRVTTMDGPGYYLPGVEWVSWWSGDYSIHGTYWHHNFGHVMSHGCVNASNGDAEWLYNWDEVGTPVYIHY